MDSKSFVLLERLYDLAGDRPFVILEAEEMRGDAVKEDELAASVESLAGEGYVAVKYADKDEYCLGVTAQGRALVVEVRDERERRKQAAEEAKKAEAARKEAERKAAVERKRAEEARLKAEKEKKEAEEKAAREKEKLERELREARQALEEERNEKEATVFGENEQKTAEREVAADRTVALRAPAEAKPADQKGQAPQQTDSSEKEGDVVRENLPTAQNTGVNKEGKTALLVWLAAFFGALLGGGVVGLVMYILHITLK